jgi:membrane carboxypeptidase/penicillin-binding protein
MICDLAVQAKIYPECMKNYPFVLGAQALHMIDLAGFYATIVNEGRRITPYAIDSIEKNGHAIYRHQAGAPVWLADGDRAAVFQMRTLREGVVARGTAASMKSLTGFIGGKTGTTDNENDAWFVGFTSDVTVAVWVGYDNAKDKRTLGHGETGGKVSVPIAEPIIQATWNLCGPKTLLPPPSAEAAKRLKAIPIDYNSGQKLASAKNGAFTEYFKLDEHKALRDTQYLLTSRHALARGEPPRAAAPVADERPLVVQPQAPVSAGRLPPSDRVPRSLRQLFGF